MAHFQKAYTRDNMLIIQEAWQWVLGTGLAQTLGVEDPGSVPSIFYVTDGVVEIWENEEHFEWIHEQMLKKNQEEPGMAQEVWAEHQKTLAEVTRAKEKQTFGDVDQLRAFIDLLYKGSQEFVVLYYSAMDERTPEPAKQIAVEFRRLDHFYDDCDHILRTNLKRFFPDYAGLETSVLRSEVQGQPAEKSDLEERNRAFVFIPGQTAEKVLLNDFARNHPEYVFDFDPIDPEVAKNGLKGNVSFKGKVQGRVRIIKRKDQVGELEEGEILVAPMTTPHFLPAMHKAAAFVTDEGGITCHAAIIARELKKPCITGTKVATQVLRDGDLVEVDAEAGRVFILERKTLEA